MEGHPIPQDVTSFQFRLIGDMTLKQFAYLAVGVVAAWFFFALPILFIIRFPISLLFALLGFSLAFVPVEGRPMDTMLSYFVQSLFAPNIYVFQKTGGVLVPELPKTRPSSQIPHVQSAPLPKIKLEEVLGRKNPKKVNALDEKELSFLKSLALSSSPTSGTPYHSAPHIISQAEETKEPPKIIERVVEPPKPPKGEPSAQKVKDETSQREQALNQQVFELQKKLLQREQQNPTVDITKESDKLETLLKETQFQKEQLEKQLITLQNQLTAQQQKTFTPTKAQPPSQTQFVRQVPKTMAKSVGLPLTPDVPNVITGIIKDVSGAILPNILVEIKDKSGNPIRAFKTNGLGQFASATPLQNGVYTIAFEDPEGRHDFDAAELPVSGAIIEPLEIIAKDPREDLRKALFTPIGTQNQTL